MDQVGPINAVIRPGAVSETPETEAVLVGTAQESGGLALHQRQTAGSWGT